VDTSPFDLLRARLEAAVERPAVIAITSSTLEDGNDHAAWGLACSLAATGYPTAFVDARVSNSAPDEPTKRLRLDDIVAQLVASHGMASFALLTLGDPALQRSTSQRNIVSAFELLHRKFDYVVISADSPLGSPFATALIAAADSVLVAVKIGRREQDSDVTLSTSLQALGDRFLGIVAMDPSVIRKVNALDSPSPAISEWRLRHAERVASELQHREAAGWPT
jgi:Mrp family chromosome partitioning ATPase